MTLKIRFISDTELLEYLLHGYSLEMLLRDDVIMRSEYDSYNRTQDEIDYMIDMRNLYIDVYKQRTNGDYSYQYRTFQQPNNA